jgi:hypothetical protein
MADDSRTSSDVPDHAGGIDRHRNRSNGSYPGNEAKRQYQEHNELYRVRFSAVLRAPPERTGKKTDAEQEGMN